MWSCNQDPFVIRADLARIFGIGVHAIRIHTPLIGGGFGGKSYCKMEPLVALMARKAGAPVRLQFTREDYMSAGMYRPMYVHAVKAGLDASDNLAGWQHTIVAGQETYHAGVATDAVAHSNTASTITDNTVTYDTTAPVLQKIGRWLCLDKFDSKHRLVLSGGLNFDFADHLVTDEETVFPRALPAAFDPSPRHSFSRQAK
jgi:hypothetical protein